MPNKFYLHEKFKIILRLLVQNQELEGDGYGSLFQSFINIISHSYNVIMTEYTHGMLSQYIPNISVQLHLPLIRRLITHDAVNVITLPLELSKSLVNGRNCLYRIM